MNRITKSAAPCKSKELPQLTKISKPFGRIRSDVESETLLMS